MAEKKVWSIGVWLRAHFLRRPFALDAVVGRAIHRRRRMLGAAIYDAMEVLEKRIFLSSAPAPLTAAPLLPPLGTQPQVITAGAQATFVAIQSYENAVGARFYNQSGSQIAINNLAVGDFTGNGNEDYEGGRDAAAG